MQKKLKPLPGLTISKNPDEAKNASISIKNKPVKIRPALFYLNVKQKHLKSAFIFSPGLILSANSNSEAQFFFTWRYTLLAFLRGGLLNLVPIFSVNFVDV